MFKAGNIIFLANTETSHACEVVVEIKKRADNIITSEKIMIVHKQQNPQTGEINYKGLLDGGLLSNRSVISDAPLGEVFFNLDRFDMQGIVTNKEIIEQFKKTTGSIIQPTAAAKKILLS